MMFINYIYIYVCDIFTKISFLTTQSIINIIKLTPSYISKIKSSSTDDNIRINNTYYKKNKILNKCVYKYNMDNNQDCDWGWFVEIDDVHIRR